MTEITAVDQNEFSVYLVKKTPGNVTDEQEAQPVQAATTRENIKRITMIVDCDFHRRLKMHALLTNETLEDVCRAALTSYLIEHEAR